jgi:hypothetical protein
MEELKMDDVKTMVGLIVVTLVTLVLLLPMLPYCGVWYLSRMLQCSKVNIWLDNVGVQYGNKIVKPVLRKIDRILPITILLNI